MSEEKIKKPTPAWVIIGFLVTVILFATSLEYMEDMWPLFVFFILADILALGNYFNKMKVYGRLSALPGEIREHPLNAAPLESPARIVVVRESSVVGMAIPYRVYINGIPAGKLGNGKALETETSLSHNIVYVTDHRGNPFRGEVVADLDAGECKEIHIKAGRYKNR